MLAAEVATEIHCLLVIRQEPSLTGRDAANWIHKCRSGRFAGARVTVAIRQKRQASARRIRGSVGRMYVTLDLQHKMAYSELCSARAGDDVLGGQRKPVFPAVVQIPAGDADSTAPVIQSDPRKEDRSVVAGQAMYVGITAGSIPATVPADIATGAGVDERWRVSIRRQDSVPVIFAGELVEHLAL